MKPALDYVMLSSAYIYIYYRLSINHGESFFKYKLLLLRPDLMAVLATVPCPNLCAV
jgi:hypothetical protein